MMISSFQNATKALQHVAAAEVAHRADRSAPDSGHVAPAVPPPHASREDAGVGSGSRDRTGHARAAEAYAPSPPPAARTVTVTVTMTVHDGGQVDIVL